MSSAHLRLLATDLRAQARNGFYAVYAVLTAVFVVILLVTPTVYRTQVFELIVLLDPTFMGFFFAGGLILLERDQGVLPLIVTRGRGFHSWWRAKVSAILALALLVVGALVGLTAAGGLLEFHATELALMVLGLVLTVPAFFSLGVAAAGRFPRVIDYFVYSAIIMTPAMFPLVELLGISVGAVGAISPVWGALVLVTAGLGADTGALEIVGAVVSLLAWNLIGYRLAGRGFEKLSGVAGGEVGPAPGRPAARAAHRRRRVPGRTLRSVVGTEMRLILREPATAGILFAPLVIAPLLGRGLPLALSAGGMLAGMLPEGVAAAVLARMDYVRSFAVLLIAALYGILGGLLYLDEKDTGMVPVLQTLPGPRRWYLYRRCARLMGLYVVMIAAAVPLSGMPIAGMSIGTGSGVADDGATAAVSVLIAVLSMGVDALAIPMFFFALSVVAKTKLQGLALTKVINIFIVPPLIMAAVPSRWVWLIGIFPTAWGTLVRTATTDPLHAVAAAAIGIVYAVGVTVLLLRRI